VISQSDMHILSLTLIRICLSFPYTINPTKTNNRSRYTTIKSCVARLFVQHVNDLHRDVAFVYNNRFATTVERKDKKQHQNKKTQTKTGGKEY